MAGDWQELARRLDRASGCDTALDAAVAEAFEQPAADYSASVDAARRLVAAALPGWTLHLGFGATGVFPYAGLAADGTRIVCDAPTVPLAVLRVAVAVRALPPRPASPEPSALPAS
jgi:hypothetical protein